MKLVVPIFYQQYNAPENPNEFSVWNDYNDVYVYVDGYWRKMCAYKIEGQKINTNNDKVNIPDMREIDIEYVSNIDGMANARIKNKINELVKAIKQLDAQLKERE